MNIKRLMAVCGIFGCTAAGWFFLGGVLAYRSNSIESRLTPEITHNWGPELTQEPPTLFYETPSSQHGRREIQPEGSQVRVGLKFEPKQKGLLWYRTYQADFEADYLVKNPTPVAQTVYAVFHFPAREARYDQFSLKFGEKETSKPPIEGEIRESLLLAPGAEAPLHVTYRAAGMNRWTYSLRKAPRVKDLHLQLTTNFREINIPAGAESPTSRDPNGLRYQWDYRDMIGATAVGMDMPAVTNPGYVAGRITFFAPVSLLFFFSVLVMASIRQGIDLHPMNYFFLAAGCFAFQLLFAYLVDLLPLMASFLIAAAVSLALVSGYLWRACGARFARVAAAAQFAYMVLFSYSFFFDGLTGITVAIGAVVTLALLMVFTARINWAQAFRTPRPA